MKHLVKQLLILAGIFFLVSHKTHAQKLDEKLLDCDKILYWHIDSTTGHLYIYAFHDTKGTIRQISVTAYEKLTSVQNLNNKEHHTHNLWDMLKQTELPGTFNFSLVTEKVYNKNLELLFERKEVFHFLPDSIEGKMLAKIDTSQFPDIIEYGFFDKEHLHAFQNIANVFSHIPQAGTVVRQTYDLTKTLNNLPDNRGNETSLICYREVQEPDVVSAGFITKLTSKVLSTPGELKSMKSFTDVKLRDEFQLGYCDTNILVNWYLEKKEKRNDHRSYKHVAFDQNGEVDSYFMFSSNINCKPIVLNKTTLDKNGIPCGFVSIFGYDKSGEKEWKGEDRSLFDLILTNRLGQKVFHTSFHFGENEKDLNLFEAFYDDGKVYLLNHQELNMLKGNFDILSIDSTGQVRTTCHKSNSDRTLTFFPENFFGGTQRITGVTQNNIWFISRSYEDRISNGNTPDIRSYNGLRAGRISTRFDEIQAITCILPSSANPPGIYVLDHDENTLSHFVSTETGYYLVTFTNTGKTLVQELFREGRDLNTTEADLKQLNSLVLVDRNDKVCYFLVQKGKPGSLAVIKYHY